MRVPLRVPLKSLSILSWLAVVFLTSCFNNSENTKTASRSISSGTRTTQPSSNSSFAFSLSSVVRSNQSPDTTLEAITTGGDLGTNCPTLTSCKCVFTWTDASGNVWQPEQDPSYVESNMIRCLFTKVNDGVTAFTVKIKVLAGDVYSNEVQVFVNSLSPGQDPSNISNYLQVRRFMCRDMLLAASNTKKYRNNSLFDPILWNDYSNAYNLYTTSLGKDYGASPVVLDGSPTYVDGYECPMTPNDSSENPIYDLKVFSNAPINLSSPTATNVASGDITIFPADDNLPSKPSGCTTGEESTCEKYRINRSDFYLTRFQSGIFKEPFCVKHRVLNLVNPALDCTINPSQGAVVVGNSSVGRDVIGFAARPNSDQSCPNTAQVTLPTGKKWAKVWMFKATYPKRVIQQEVLNEQAIGDLFCTSRDQECLSSLTPAATIAGAPNQKDNTVCYNVTGGTGSKIGPQIGATQDGTFSTPGFGNCNPTGLAGDGNGSQAGGAYAEINDGASGLGDIVCTNQASADLTARSMTAQSNCCMDANIFAGSSNNNLPANFTPGGGYCTPTLIGANNANTLTGGPGKDIWLMGTVGRKACIEADTDFNGRMVMSFPPNNPNPYILGPRDLEASAKEDTLFVVTPESVRVEDMLDPQNHPVAKQYTPFRILPNGTRIDYNLVSGSANTSTAADRYSTFPLCVIQDSAKGTKTYDDVQ